MAKSKKPGTSYPAPVAPPTGLTVELINGVPVLRWNPVPGATTYWVGRDGRFYDMVHINEFVDNYAGHGVTHTYNVAAVVSEVLGGWCNYVSIVIP